MVCTACVVYPWSNNINPDMDMATPGALGTRMVRIRIIAHKDLRGCKFVAYTMRKELPKELDLLTFSMYSLRFSHNLPKISKFSPPQRYGYGNAGCTWHSHGKNKDHST